MAVAGCACLAAMASAPLAITTFGNNGLTLPGLSSAQRLMAMLDARSPGEREKGALFQTKVKKRLAAIPRERALGKVFPPKPSPTERLAQVVVAVPPTPPIEIVPPIAPIAPPSVGDIISPASLIASAPLAIGSAIIGGGGGGGGGGSSPPPGTTPPPTSEVPPTVPSAVPEPGSWLMMLVGFGAVGAAMRRRPRAQLLAA